MPLSLFQTRLNQYIFTYWSDISKSNGRHNGCSPIKPIYVILKRTIMLELFLFNPIGLNTLYSSHSVQNKRKEMQKNKHLDAELDNTRHRFELVRNCNKILDFFYDSPSSMKRRQEKYPFRIKQRLSSDNLQNN